MPGGQIRDRNHRGQDQFPEQTERMGSKLIQQLQQMQDLSGIEQPFLFRRSGGSSKKQNSGKIRGVNFSHSTESPDITPDTR